MKKPLQLITAALFLVLPLSLSAQSFADDPSDITPAQNVDPETPQPVWTPKPKSGIACASPIVTAGAAVCDSGMVTLSATNGLSFLWYDTTGQILLHDTTFTVHINTTTNYMIAGICDPDSALMPIPPPTSSHNGMIRGYFFTAPTSFTITALRVPTDVAGNQTIEVIRFDSGAPPVYPGTTNNFTSLGYWQNVNSTNKIYTNIFVTEGDVIGIYGWRGTTNSYSAGGGVYNTTIAGFPVVLDRSGMQDNLNTSQMHDVWNEIGGSLSRTEMYYTFYGDTSTHVMGTATVNQSSTVSLSADICQGDSLLLGTNYYSSPGTYHDTLMSAGGCDSIVELILGVNALPAVAAAQLADDTICVTHATQTLTGTPPGGTWAGPGVTGNAFSPFGVTPGTHGLIYTFADMNGCSNQDTVFVNVEACTGIADAGLMELVKIYPNPASEYLMVDLSSLAGNAVLTVEDVRGRRIYTNESAAGVTRLELDQIAPAKGIYLVRVQHEGKVSVHRITRN